MIFRQCATAGAMTLALGLLVACQTTPVRYEHETQGQWQAKALVRDKSERRSAIVNLEIRSIKHDKFRMDVTAALGHPVASLVIDGKEMTYVLFETKQYFRGTPSSASLKPVINVPLDPRIIDNIFFDEPITEKEWTCTRDRHNYLAECRRLTSDLVITWSERKGRRKLVNIENGTTLVQINVTSFQPKVEQNPNPFILNPPKSFKMIR
jgi:hypothetical protein